MEGNIMKKITGYLFSLLLALLLLPQANLFAQAAAAPPSGGIKGNASAAVQKSLLAAVEQWKQAVITKNRAGLERIFHDELTYGHTTGEVLDKHQSIERVLSSKGTYTSIDLSNVTIRVYGKVALITANTAFHITTDGKPAVASLSGIDVWIQSEKGWQLLARQLTRPPLSSEALLAEAREIQTKIVTFDSHLDIPLNFGTPGLEAGIDGPTQFDLVKAQRGLLKGASLAIFVPQGPRTPEATAKALEQAEKKYEIITDIAKTYPNRAAIAYSPTDLRRIEGDNKFAIVLSILNTYPLGDDLTQIDNWYKKGVRIIGFTHAGNNDFSDSSRPNLLRGDKLDEHGGLSDLGKQAVVKLNDLGILIDVSQLSSNALHDVLSLTRAPVAATHSDVRGIVDHPRNLSDEELLAIKKNDGVVQISAYDSWVRNLPADAQRKANEVRKEFGEPTETPIAAAQPLTEKGVVVLSQEKFEEYSKKIHEVILDTSTQATLSQFVDQIDYAVKKIGIDHVGISSDFNHGGGVVGWNNEGESLNVTAELLRRGYKEDDIRKLWGGNFLRVWEKAQSLAKK
jgi:microsomal dipeptidase-like Zn-dependent dipeptidase